MLYTIYGKKTDTERFLLPFQFSDHIFVTVKHTKRRYDMSSMLQYKLSNHDRIIKTKVDLNKSHPFFSIILMKSIKATGEPHPKFYSRNATFDVDGSGFVPCQSRLAFAGRSIALITPTTMSSI